MILMMKHNQYFKILVFLVWVFSTTAMYAQYDAISNLPLKQNPAYQWANESKRASIKEAKMQVDFYLKQNLVLLPYFSGPSQEVVIFSSHHLFLP